VWGWFHIAGIVSLWGAAVLTIYTGFSYVQANLAHVSQEDARDRQRRHAEARHST
jgi:phosphatidylglycerophosphate synthase